MHFVSFIIADPLKMTQIAWFIHLFTITFHLFLCQFIKGKKGLERSSSLIIACRGVIFGNTRFK